MKENEKDPPANDCRGMVSTRRRAIALTKVSFLLGIDLGFRRRHNPKGPRVTEGYAQGKDPTQAQ